MRFMLPVPAEILPPEEAAREQAWRDRRN